MRKAMEILRQAYQALQPGGRLFVIEMLLTDESFNGGLCDLHLLTVTGGQERTEAEFCQLFHETGFRLTKAHPCHAVDLDTVCPAGDGFVLEVAQARQQVLGLLYRR